MHVLFACYTCIHDIALTHCISPIKLPSPSFNVPPLSLSLLSLSPSPPPFSLQHSHYQVFVVLLPEGFDVNSLSPPNEQFPNINILTDVYQLTLCDEKPTTPKAYITAEFDDSLFPSNKLFIVGQESPTNQAPNDRPDTYTNGELCYSGKFTFFTRAYIDTVSCSPGTRNWSLFCD